MVDEGVSYTINSLYDELVQRVEDEGASSNDEVTDIISSILEDHTDKGEMSDQINIERLRDVLRLRWEQRDQE